MNFYIMGVLGHIDHGKTTLTKALTGVDTDQLKEEKQRKISIELGFAPIQFQNNYQASIIDIPGHEKFIKKAIAGASGLDLAILVVAANEGIMYQTKEHLEIISLLSVQRIIVVVTKMDLVNQKELEIITINIKNFLKDTRFSGAKVVHVDGISYRGVSELKHRVSKELEKIPSKDINTPLRMPIDQVFTLRGYGTVTRGTLYDGKITSGQLVTILPGNLRVKVKEMQYHNQITKNAYAGQRVALNISGVNKENIKRGQVIVDSDYYISTQTIDVKIKTVNSLRYKKIKQHEHIMIHIGTTNSTGKIIFFDRNSIEFLPNEEIYCQIRLDNPIVAKKGDSLILRKLSPTETFAGGIILQTQTNKYPFGKETIKKLVRLDNDPLLEQLISLLEEHMMMTEKQLAQYIGVSEHYISKLLSKCVASGVLTSVKGQYTAQTVMNQLRSLVLNKLRNYHRQHPLKYGIPKAELISSLSELYPPNLILNILINLDNDKLICFRGPNVCIKNFRPEFPSETKKEMIKVIRNLEKQGLEPAPVLEILSQSSLNNCVIKDFLFYIEKEGVVERLNDKYVVHYKNIKESIYLLKKYYPYFFTVQDAKKILKLSRKYLIPFLEHLDRKKVTTQESSKRVWIE
ncbi:selenocysteine-specific translation elongation factor [Lentibacillus populi]|uniref:Selenocysteine-specific elongation factor n=1 Tax=Lentibacillus populi TaxID=1827502 RepID=A0A9W5X613_9BACI|nr:selenocysteine-specific translation elongation factor [Lentibacillus populi]GGB44614.1 selenocysteine-specific translation elongation factor [Lentibacillus populi]